MDGELLLPFPPFSLHSTPLSSPLPQADPVYTSLSLSPPTRPTLLTSYQNLLSLLGLIAHHLNPPPPSSSTNPFALNHHPAGSSKGGPALNPLKQLLVHPLVGLEPNEQDWAQLVMLVSFRVWKGSSLSSRLLSLMARLGVRASFRLVVAELARRFSDQNSSKPFL